MSASDKVDSREMSPADTNTTKAVDLSVHRDNAGNNTVLVYTVNVIKLFSDY